MYGISWNKIKITKHFVKTYCYSQYKRNKMHKLITHISNLLPLQNLAYIFFICPHKYNLTFFWFFYIISNNLLIYHIDWIVFQPIFFLFQNNKKLWYICNRREWQVFVQNPPPPKKKQTKKLTSMLLAHQKPITNNSQLSYLTNYTVSNLVEFNRCDLFFISPSSDTPLSELFYN